MSASTVEVKGDIFDNPFKLEIGDKYYSIGALQSLSGIEEWTYTGDRYDHIRMKMGFVLKTREAAEALRDYLTNYLKEQHESI